LPAAAIAPLNVRQAFFGLSEKPLLSAGDFWLAAFFSFCLPGRL
jgi:hypothetical protein